MNGYSHIYIRLLFFYLTCLCFLAVLETFSEISLLENH